MKVANESVSTGKEGVRT